LHICFSYRRIMTHDDRADAARATASSHSVPLASAITGDALTVATRITLGTVRCGGAGVARVRALRRRRRRIILVGWHGHDFLSLAIYLRLFRGEARGVIMVPATRRGLSLRRFAERAGYDVVVLPDGDAPSTDLNRGIATMARLVREGRDGLIALDGPSGPAQRAKPGAFMIARRAGAVLVPTAAAARPAIRLRWRWDDHRLPLPFARAVAYYGRAIDPAEWPRDRSNERAMLERVTRDLRYADERARALCTAR
jgi:lysophospholipid acyltransferase (LPLAT)-like uncharacterized protein